jgi:hypothetical protein
MAAAEKCLPQPDLDGRAVFVQMPGKKVISSGD